MELKKAFWQTYTHWNPELQAIHLQLQAKNTLILFLPLSPELILSAFCPTTLSRECRVKVITTSMLLNPLALQQYSPSLTSDTVDCCILRNTFVSLYGIPYFPGYVLPSWPLFCLLRCFLYPTPQPQALDSTSFFVCLSSCGFKYHHKLTVFTITSFPKPQNQIINYLLESALDYLRASSNLTHPKQTTPHSCPLNPA